MLKLKIVLSGNSFEYEADELQPLMEFYRLWVGAQGSGPDAIKLEALTERLKNNNTALSAVVEQFSSSIKKEA